MRVRFLILLPVFWAMIPQTDASGATINVIPDSNPTLECIFNGADSVAQSCSASGVGTTYQGFGHVQGDLLSGLHAKATSTFTATSSGGQGGQAGADATISDTATLNGAPATGFLTFFFAVDGTLSLADDTSNAGNNDHVDEFMSVSVNGTIFDSTVLFDPAVSAVNTIQTVNVSYSGTSLSLVLGLDTTADCRGGGPNTSCSAVADFSNTATIVGLEVFNSTGSLVPDATLTSTTGYVYPSGTPEPSSVLLFSTGLIGVLLLSRRFWGTSHFFKRF